MRTLPLLLTVLSVLPSVTFGQSGLGSFEYIGRPENRPVIQSGFKHPNGARVSCFSLPGKSCNGPDCRTDRERAQVLQNRADNTAGDSFRYSFSFFLPSDFKDVQPANLILWEMRPLGSGKPSTIVEIVEGQLQFSLSNPEVIQKDNMNPEQPVIIKRLSSIPRGRWTEIRVDARWSRGEDGILQVYHNGRLAVDHRGINIDENSLRQQVMYGVYRSFISRYMRATGQTQMPLQQACFANVSRQPIQFE